jgi:dTDP-4-dehydrorhamnose reductase
MKILLLGKNGQLGWELQRALSPIGELVALEASGTPPWGADLARPHELAATVHAHAPEFIVNAAAYTAVDRAEAEPDLARTVNAVAPGVLAAAAAARGAWLVHYSTDHVFDGSGHLPWRECDAAHPLNAYGRSKLEGELAVRAAGCRHLILRTSWVYAARRSNFMRSILQSASTCERVDVVDDQIGAPTGAAWLADLTSSAICKLRASPSLAGTYHAAPAGQTNRYEWARYIIELARRAGHPLKVLPAGVVPVPSASLRSPARRPLNSRLDTRKLQQGFGLTLPDWRVGMDEVVNQLLRLAPTDLVRPVAGAGP